MNDAGRRMIEDAAAGHLPIWAEAGPPRLAHISRVADLMDRWAAAMDVGGAERERWRAAAWLHDALRDADPESLRESVAPDLRDLPGGMLHGPAAAARLDEAGVDDARLLNAVAYHTLGHPDLDRLGRALYLADFLEPGRVHQQATRAVLRARVPEHLDQVLIDVAAARIGHLLERHKPIRPETQAFWNSLVDSAGYARAP